MPPSSSTVNIDQIEIWSEDEFLDFIHLKLGLWETRNCRAWYRRATQNIPGQGPPRITLASFERTRADPATLQDEIKSIVQKSAEDRVPLLILMNSVRRCLTMRREKMARLAQEIDGNVSRNMVSYLKREIFALVTTAFEEAYSIIQEMNALDLRVSDDEEVP
ncbi:hypothetical protein BTUL_0313g00030 [Botrytis tulipae]|uniref:Uncharacterized protein n=1 Tax=Botrytis tulipae TaxID=87230 RepID=A0A4Z1E5C4_9HELO|nr:hypothetical protein BTUL_0313g00030 [Botrytis tulipae]